MVATLDRPKRTKGQPTEDNEFVVFEAVPLFDLHTGDDGVEYDERLLQAIAGNCNRRIRNTGDWTPIVVAHTRDKDEKAHANDDPPVIGLAGPFYVADFVNSDGQKSRAIHATFWIFPDQEQTFLRNPRRSVEIWPEEQPEQRYFDPISVLGAETPKRDLGMIYSRRAGSTSRPTHHYLNGPLRYSKRYTAPLKYQEVVSTPGGNNTFLPGDDLKKNGTPNSRARISRKQKPSRFSRMAKSKDIHSPTLSAKCLAPQPTNIRRVQQWHFRPMI